MSAHHRGDDLEDDYVPDDLVASSGEEEDALASHVPASDDIGGLLSADEDAEQESAALAKRKRREKEKERKTKKRKLVETRDDDEAPSVAAQPPHELAGYLSSIQAKAYPAKSTLELLDISIPDRNLNCGHDIMDGIEVIGPSSRIHHQSPSTSSQEAAAAAESLWLTDVAIHSWCCLAGGGYHQSSQG